MPMELLVNFDEFWPRLREDISTARASVLIQTFALEGDEVGRQLSETLLSSPAREKKILADSFTRIVISDRFKYSPANLFDGELRDEARATRSMMDALRAHGVELKFTNAYGLTPRSLLSRNHKKLIVIDNRAAYIGGINFSEHNAAWHDMMIRIDDHDVVRVIRDDFDATWSGKDLFAAELFDDLELLTMDGHGNRAVFQRVIDLIDGAEDSIFVESPYITFPFYERLREAARRDVDVKIVTPLLNNWSYFANYARLESARSGIDLRLYQGGMTHLKAMLIDNQHLIAGSSNFDYLSYRLYQEIVAIIRDENLIADFCERVMLPDLANSLAVECRGTAVERQWLNLHTRLVEAALTIFT
ncbi:MAG TPA: phosphatidylserine/phosphatidylglycerophosphate/cardiolipin synthase family protein [Pyrinomonadaceae bacterium]|jgi:cardiolipin synthase|nr:phosphatidylserine/phosphatidylglycerophosphate/cardiolipin synthase family protein [Pyrinomonadaceae bacterium]